MTATRCTRILLPALAALAAALPAQQAGETTAPKLIDPTPGVEPTESPIATALEQLGGDVQEFERHVVTLANPFLQGRLPGTPGMAFAKDYCEAYLRQAGLQPAFPVKDRPEELAFRQPFPLTGRRDVRRQSLAVVGIEPAVDPAAAEQQEERPSRDRAPAVALELEPGEDFVLTGLGEATEVELTGEAVFIGYGIDEGPDGFVGYPADLSLEGKIAVVFHFEPVDDEGVSRWADPERGPWSRAAAFARKLQRLELAKPKAVVFVNPPGVVDPRSNELVPDAGGGQPVFGGPVFQLTSAAGERLLQTMHAGEGEAPGLRALRERADEGNTVIDLRGKLRLAADIGRSFEMVENVGGLLEGKGRLAEQLIVVGAHLDHLGTGLFGARDPRRIGQVHPGADDNASGSAGVLMLASKLAAEYAAMPDDAEARSILFVLFTAEESGLHGARYYTRHPIRPLAMHALMTNFDMIGRVSRGKLLVAGADSAEGMGDWLEPLFAQTKLDIVSGNMMIGSDHLAFYGARVPVLFAICANFHADYHTPDDVDWKINRVAAVHTIELFRGILKVAAMRRGPFLFAGQGGPLEGVPGAVPGAAPSAETGEVVEEKPASAGAAAGRPAGAPVGVGAGGERRVRFGIMPGYGSTGGVLVEGVFDDTPAGDAGVEKGDVMIRWNGEDLVDVRGWVGLLNAAKPGDKVRLVVERGGKEVELEVTLTARS